MSFKTCKNCICEPVCPKCFAYKDVLNVSDYCEHFINKAEAVKEFAERLKETANSRMYRKDVVYIVEIDDLVKEMAGAESGS